MRTPGPWKVVTEKHAHYLGGIHTERRIFTAWDDPQLKGPMGVVNGSIGLGSEKGGPARHLITISEDDANLIAEAPALLDVCERIVAWCDETGAGDGLYFVKLAREVVARIMHNVPAQATAKAAHEAGEN